VSKFKNAALYNSSYLFFKMFDALEMQCNYLRLFASCLHSVFGWELYKVLVVLGGGKPGSDDAHGPRWPLFSASPDSNATQFCQHWHGTHTRSFSAKYRCWQQFHHYTGKSPEISAFPYCEVQFNSHGIFRNILTFEACS
jgi:hypothetical protein